MKQQELTAAAQIIHVVQPAETLSSIDRLYGVTYQAIMEANGLTDPGLIGAGQESIIPPPEQPPLARGNLLLRLGALPATAPPGRRTLVCARPSLSLCQRCGMIIEYTFAYRTALSASPRTP